MQERVVRRPVRERGSDAGCGSDTGLLIGILTNSMRRLACGEDLVLTRATNRGTDRAGGGSFERVILALVEFDADGRIVRWEPFEAYDEAAALARFDELAR